MDTDASLTALSALAQKTRLDVFRLLMRAGPEGMPAGDIAAALGVRQNTMSSNLSILAQSGLIAATREGRVIRYHADLDAIRALIGFLVEECCGGEPGKCQPLLDQITCP